MNKEHEAQIPLVDRIKALQTLVLNEISMIDGEVLEARRMYRIRLENVSRYLEELDLTKLTNGGKI